MSSMIYGRMLVFMAMRCTPVLGMSLRPSSQPRLGDGGGTIVCPASRDMPRFGLRLEDCKETLTVS